MATPKRLEDSQIISRVSREFETGQTVAVGQGLPEMLLQLVSASSGVHLLGESGVLSGGSASHSGEAVLGTVETAAMMRSGHLDWSVIQAAQVDAEGNFTHWTTAANPSLGAPGFAVDLASGPRRVAAVMHHNDPAGNPNIVGRCEGPIDSAGCVTLIVTDLAVIERHENGLTLTEVAPGWSADDVVAQTGALLGVSPNLKEMCFDPNAGAPPNKVFASGADAVRDIPDGATIMIDGFGGPGGMAHYLLVSLRDQGAKDLTIISNTAGIARIINFGTPPGKLAIDHTLLIDNKQVRKAIASYPVSPSASNPSAFELAYRRGEVELELVPQGTLAERLRAGGAGVGAFYTPTGVGTRISEGKETRTIDGKEYLLETGLKADYCLIRGYKADSLGNVVYKGTSRNFNAVMAPAAAITIVEVDEIVEPGQLDPEVVVTPAPYISRVVQRPAEFSAYE